MQVKRRSAKIRKHPRGNKFWRKTSFRFLTRIRMKIQARVKVYLKEIDAIIESQLW